MSVQSPRRAEWVAMRRAYLVLNKGLFEGSLPDAKFRLNLGRKSIFYMSPPSGRRSVCLEIGTAIVSACRIQILDELVHVMVHIANWLAGVEDHTQNQYHNVQFRNLALEKGLHVLRHKARGWGLTTSRKPKYGSRETIRCPDPEARRKLLDLYRVIDIPEDVLSTFQRGIAKKITSKPQRQFLLKYVCQCEPPVIVRSGRRPDGSRPLNVWCHDCNAKFVVDKVTEVP